MTDAELVRRCRAGDADAYRELLARYQTDVTAVCVRILGHHQDAEDIAQESFVRFVRSLHRWDELRPLKPWLLKITVNRCRTALARRARLPRTTEHLADFPARPETQGQGELAAIIATAVSRLRPEYREVFILFHDRGLPYDEIAMIVERPVGTIKTWLHRARAELVLDLTARGLAPTPPSLPECP